MVSTGVKNLKELISQARILLAISKGLDILVEKHQESVVVMNLF